MIGILSGLFTALRAIPALADLIGKLADAWKAHSEAANRAEADKRAQQKLSVVDAALAAAGGVRNDPQSNGQHGKVDEKTRLL